MAKKKVKTKVAVKPSARKSSPKKSSVKPDKKQAKKAEKKKKSSPTKEVKKTSAKVGTKEAKPAKTEKIELPMIEISHDAETLAALNKPKEIFKKKWYEKKKSSNPEVKSKKVEKKPSLSYSEQQSKMRYVRKRKKKK